MKPMTVSGTSALRILRSALVAKAISADALHFETSVAEFYAVAASTASFDVVELSFFFVIIVAR
jgi:hypothetical protein